MLAWTAIVSLMLGSLPLGWWLIAVGRRSKTARALTPALALGVYVPALVAAPLLPQPRARGRLLRLVGLLLLAAGLTVRLLALWEFRRQRASIAPETWVPPHLVTTGIYRFVRHPMYLADALMFTGWCCRWRALRALWLVAPIAWLTAWLRGHWEDRYLLESAFGEEFRAYKNRTGIFLPRIGRRRRR